MVRRGFTLIEIVLVFVLIPTIAAMAVFDGSISGPRPRAPSAMLPPSS